VQVRHDIVAVHWCDGPWFAEVDDVAWCHRDDGLVSMSYVRGTPPGPMAGMVLKKGKRAHELPFPPEAMAAMAS
jgi:hypothetical protein